MNADTGIVHPLPDLKTVGGGSWWPEVGQPITPSCLPSHDEGLSREEKGQLETLRGAVYAEEPIVVVSGTVAQQVTLGRRELERRRRRGKAAKQARRRNRS